MQRTSKIKDEVVLQKIEETNKQFFIEKNISSTEKKNPYEIETDKNAEIMLEIEKNSRICRRVYQSLFIEAADTFIQYTNTLSPDEIDQIDEVIRSNGWGFNVLLKLKILLNFYAYFKYFTILTEGFHLKTVFCRFQIEKHQKDLKNIHENFV